MRNNILKYIVQVCLYLVLLTPLLFWSKFLFPYITPKAVYFRCLIEIALFFYILLIIYQPQYRPRFSKLGWVVLIYLLFITFSSIFGVNLYRSFWGNIERGEGLLTIYHLFIFFILITALFKEKKQWLRFFDISVLISLLVSLYALAQKLDLSFVYHAGTTRLDGTLGNASFLAAYLLMNIFLCLFLFANKKHFFWRLYYGMVFFLGIFILLNTQTRGAVLGLFGGFLVLTVLTVIFSKSKKVKLNFSVILLILLILATAIWFCREEKWVKNIPGVHRMAEISLQDVTTQSRLLSWQAAWHGWQDKFFLGYGYENYNVAFNKYFPALIYKDSHSRVWFDRAHNVIFDQAVPGGIFGLLAYLSIFWLTLWIIWPRRYLKEASRLNNSESIILISLLVAYFAQKFFVFDILASYITLYAILGFVSYLSIGESEANGQNQNVKGRQPRLLIIAILILLLVFSLHFFNIRLAWTNHYCAKALAYSHANMHREAMNEFKKALEQTNNQTPEIRQYLVMRTTPALMDRQLTREEKTQVCNFVISEIKKNIQTAPLDAYGYLFLMSLYNNCSIFDPHRLNLVLEAGNIVLELSPTRPQIYYEMGQAAINLGRHQEGIEYFKKAVELNPAVVQARWNLASAYIITGQNELAEQEFALIEEMGWDYYSIDNLERLIRPYLSVKNFHKLVEIYQELIKLKPSSADYYARLAASYKEIGEIEKARQAVQKAVELDPSFAEEAKIFLEMLE